MRSRLLWFLLIKQLAFAEAKEPFCHSSARAVSGSAYALLDALFCNASPWQNEEAAWLCRVSYKSHIRQNSCPVQSKPLQPILGTGGR